MVVFFQSDTLHIETPVQAQSAKISPSLAAHIDTITELQGPGWDPPDSMKGFSLGQWHHDQTSLMAAQFMGSVERQGPEGAQMLAEVMPSIYLEK